MKKFIPAIVAIALIILVLAGSFGMKLLDRYSYSDDKQDLKEYYGLTDGDESSVAVVLQNEKIDVQAKLIDGRCYMDIKDVQDLFIAEYYFEALDKKIEVEKFFLPESVFIEHYFRDMEEETTKTLMVNGKEVLNNLLSWGRLIVN